MTTTEQTPSQYDVVFMTTKFSSLNEAQQKAPTQMSTHLERSQEFHVAGALLMAGAFLDQPEEPVCTMAVLPHVQPHRTMPAATRSSRLTRSMSGRFVNGRTCSPDGNRQRRDTSTRAERW